MKKYIQPILTAIGYYKVKSKWRWRQNMKQWQKIDAQRKAEATAWIEAIDHRLLPVVKAEGDVTVSLTSYSKRVTDFAPFAIYSIFHQTVLPNRIVLNINQDKWNEENLPELIKKLQVAGLEVNFCEDVGPHTKLLPAMQKYPEDVIITVDDDVYYDKELVEELLEEYRGKTSKCVVCRDALVVGYQNGELLPYLRWIDVKNVAHPKYILPLGVGGVLYSPSVFDEEAYRKEIFKDLCPYADDIWFMIQEVLKNIPIYYVKNNHWTANGDVDHYAEYVEQGSDALHFQNANNGQNDVQIAKLLSYYNISLE